VSRWLRRSPRTACRPGRRVSRAVRNRSVAARAPRGQGSEIVGQLRPRPSLRGQSHRHFRCQLDCPGCEDLVGTPPRIRTCGMAGIMQRLLDPIRARRPRGSIRGRRWSNGYRAASAEPRRDDACGDRRSLAGAQVDRHRRDASCTAHLVLRDAPRIHHEMTTRSPRALSRQTRRSVGVSVEPEGGFEPPTCRLRGHRSPATQIKPDRGAQLRRADRQGRNDYVEDGTTGVS
jgi:hypothetical protein